MSMRSNKSTAECPAVNHAAIFNPGNETARNMPQSSRSCQGATGRINEPYLRDFLRLLRLGCRARRREHGARRITFLVIGAGPAFFSDLRPLTSDLYHRITLSALANTLGGIVRPICFAAFRLMMNSNFIGCSTGRSAGLAPLRILST
jgi:hypothetical protein